MASAEIKAPSLGDRGEEVYERSLRAVLEPEHVGKIIVIEVESGEWEFAGDDGWTGLEKMKARHPGKLFYEKRVGYPYVYRFRSPRVLRGFND